MATFDDPRLTTIGLFIEVGGALERRIGEAARHHGLSHIDVDILLRLARSTGGRLRESDLVQQTGRSAQDSAGQAAGLEARGLVKLTADPVDGRPVAAITPEGGIVLSETLHDVVELFDRAVRPALGEHASAVETMLRRLRDTVHPAATVDGR